MKIPSASLAATAGAGDAVIETKARGTAMANKIRLARKALLTWGRCLFIGRRMVEHAVWLGGKPGSRRVLRC